MNARKLLAAAGVGALTGYAAYELASAYRLQTVRRTLRLPRWDADGFRVAIITDTHVNNLQQARRAQMAFELALQEEPDLLVLLGDYLDFGHDEALASLELALMPIRAFDIPVVAILGNHDYQSLNTPAVLQILVDSGAEFLMNDSLNVRGVTVFGLDDALYGDDRHDRFPENGSRSTLVLFHEPDFVGRVDRRASLVLSGHTHGGQVCLPGGKPVHLPYGGERYPAGFYPDAPVPLYVSRGVGTTRYDIRAFCPPEVSVLTLVSG